MGRYWFLSVADISAATVWEALFKTHGKTLALDALRTSMDVADDVLGSGHGFKESIKKRVPEGIKWTAESLIRQSGSGLGGRNTRKRRKTRLHANDMAFTHDISCECTKSELDLFSTPPTQTSMEQGSLVEYHPLTTVSDGSPIEFDLRGAGDYYVDFANTLLYMKAKVTQANGDNLAADTDVGPVNLFLHSLFSQVDISLNGTDNVVD